MWNLRPWDDADAFRAAATPFLATDEAVNNLPFGLLDSIARGRYEAWHGWTLARGSEVVAVCLQTPPHNLVIGHAEQHASIALADALYEVSPDLPGVNAPEPTATDFVDRWAERSGGRAERTFAQRIYACRDVRIPEGVFGGARLASMDDRDLVMGWMFAFAEDALHEAEHDSEQRAWVETRIADEELTLWEVDGRPVSMAGSSGPTPSGIRVGPVFTPRDERRRGYASAVTAAESVRRLAEGYRFCFLYTDLANPTSNSIYQQIGYEPVCDAAMVRFTP